MRPTFISGLTTLLVVNVLFLYGMRESPQDVIQPLSRASKYADQIQELKDNTSVLPPAPQGHPIDSIYNREAIIPPPCYTKTQGSYNPCYVCHQNEIPGRENRMNDEDLQVEYSFSELGTRNHWQNLFEDRSERVSGMSDRDILEYINQNNYSELAERLEQVDFQGWIPDLENLHLGKDAFDENGFAKDGSHWVAYNYKPLPSTFWPTNGSTDDVMIRLPAPFRTDLYGNESLDVYKANLAILEAQMKGYATIGCLPVDERKVGIDLDEN